MDTGQGKKIVLLGMMSRSPVAGVVWQTMHYLLGFQRLGYDVYYVEAHARTPLMLMRRADGDGSAEAAAFIAGIMRRFGLVDRWAFHALHADGRYYGMSEAQLKRLYRSAALIINLHGGTQPLPEHSATGRLVYLETDPVAPQIELHHNVQYTLDFLEPHCAFFTFGENYGRLDCELPVSDRFEFRPTRQPVVTDFWRPRHDGAGQAFTTVSSWRQLGREVVFRGEVYHWSKHHEFMKFVDLPTLANQAFELALNRYDDAEKRMLENKGWKVRDALDFSTDADAYRSYITRSRGEFTVAKDQNIRLRSGWFSDRSATYLAAGKPVVTQETGFSNILPTGQGLFAFSVMEEAVQAIESIHADYEHHCRAAFALAQEYFSYDVVLGHFLADLGLSSPASGARGKASTEAGEAPVDQEHIQPKEAAEPAGRFPQDMVLSPVSRRPTILPEATVQIVLAATADISPARYDVVSFCGVDEDPCFEEGSPLMITIAQNGHRVFHLRPELGEAEGSVGRFETRVLSTHSFEVRLRAGHSPSPEGQVVSNDQEPKLLQALGALRRSYGIEAAVGYVRCPSWGPVAVQARERWGWKVVHEIFDRAEDSSPSDPALAECEHLLDNESDLVVRTEDDPQKPDNEHDGRHIALARKQTPSARWRRVHAAVRAAYKRASFVVVTYDNLIYTKLCLESLLANTEYPNYEIVVVDNGSTDDTPSYLRSLNARHTHVRVILNAENRGFACASNQGLAVATGEVLVLLNNDTIVPRGGLTRLVRYLDDPNIGLIGPVTNRIGNEAQIEVSYDTYAGFSRFARDRMREHEGELFEVRMLAMFCLGMRRDICECIGPLDEQFGLGTFEDDDYAVRVRLAGYRVTCAQDVFVHHFGEVSFGKLAPTSEYADLLRENRHRFEQKWGKPWQPHQRRLDLRYQQLTHRLRDVVRESVPPGATVAVVSRGDEELLKLGGPEAWHFPQDKEGVYAGHHPADDAEAIARLEEAREWGADYLLFPNTAFWWLEHYAGFNRHLEERYRAVVRLEDVCRLYRLREDAHALSVSGMSGATFAEECPGTDQSDKKEASMTNQRHNPKQDASKGSARGEVAKLRRIVEKQGKQLEALAQGKQLEALARRIDRILSREDDLQVLLTSVREQLLRRDDVIQANLYDLQLAVSVQQNSQHATKHITYQHLIRRIREVARTMVPPDATVIVLSKGDDELLNLHGRTGWHFPQTKDGSYAGYYPHNSDAAIIHLETLRARGGDFLLIPQTALWWLDEYARFKKHLLHRYRLAMRQDDTCVLFALREPASNAGFDNVIAEHQSRFDHDPAILDWHTGLELAAAFPQRTVFSPPVANGGLPYVDKSIDIVVVPSSDPPSIAEAHRVATEAVVKVDSVHDDGEPGVPLKVDWKSDEASVALPTTSIIIPVFNNLDHTEICLATLMETLPRNFGGEIIVVDDASEDQTPARLKLLAKSDKRLKVMRNRKNAGFIASCNRAAKAATGEILVFLNNDTIPLSGWLISLLRIFDDYPDAGAVGGKLLYMDGTLQEAGGIVFRDGSAANFGRGDHEIDARVYNFVREVDYCSGTLLATKRSLFEGLDGFDTRYQPAYCEDSDYCFKVREAGYRVYYQPESAVVHLEGASSGTDLTRGVKRYQVVNQAKLVEKWRHALKRQPLRPSYSDRAAWQALAL